MREPILGRIGDDLGGAQSLLSWYCDAGVDELLLDEPLDRFAASELVKYSSRSIPISSDPSATGKAGDLEVGSRARAAAAAAKDLFELQKHMVEFEGCPLKHTAMNLVFGDGNPDAAVMFIGEAPGADEDREGRPFVGVSGKLLDRMMASIGLDRASVYITNILPWRPPGNREPTVSEVASCLPFIQRQIQLVAPKTLVLVGGTAAKSLLGRKEGIMKLRGRWLAYSGDACSDPIPALATFHPAFLLRSPAQKINAWKDLLMVQKKLSE